MSITFTVAPTAVGNSAGVNLTITCSVVVSGLSPTDVLASSLQVQVIVGGQWETASLTAGNWKANGTTTWIWAGPTPVGGRIGVSAEAVLDFYFLENNNWYSYGITASAAGILLNPSIVNLDVIVPSDGQVFSGASNGFTIGSSGTSSSAPGVAVHSVTWNLYAGMVATGPVLKSGNMTVAPDGSWSGPIAAPLGLYSIQFTATDANNNVQVAVARVEVTLAADIFDITQESYLQALVDFGTDPFNINGSSRVLTAAGDLLPADIDSTFFQSVGLLLDDRYSAKANEPILQPRICVEVLRKYLAAFPPTPDQAKTLASAESAYLQDAYLSLLQQIGTSFDEIRLSRTYDASKPSDLIKLQSICDRLGIELGPSSDPYTGAYLPNHLAQLCFDATGTPDIPLTFQLTVTDSNGATATSTVNVTLYGVDRPLSVSAGPNQTVNRGANVSFTTTNTDLNPQATITSYVWTQIAGPAVVLNNPNTATPSFTAPTVVADTVLTFRLTITDSIGATATTKVNVLVNGALRPLLVNAGTSQTVGYHQGSITLSGSATDSTAGAAIASWRWTQIAGPPVTLVNPNQASSGFAPPVIAAPILPLSEPVLDQMFGLVDSTRDPFSQGPTIGDTQGIITRWSLDGAEWSRGTDPDGIAYLQISFVNGHPTQLALYQNKGRSVVLATGQGPTPGDIILTPTNNSVVSGRVRIETVGADTMVGLSVFPRFLSWQFQKLSDLWVSDDVPPDTALTFQMTALDNAGNEASSVVSVNICHINRPLVSVGPNRTARPGHAIALAAVATASAAGGNIITYQWTQTAGPPVNLNGANTANATFVVPAVTNDTELTFQVTVTDSLGATASTGVTVTAFHINRLLATTASANQTVNQGANVALSGIATESSPGAAITSYQWIQLAGPPVALTAANTQNASFTAPAMNADTVLTFQLTVTDSTGATVTANANITVYGGASPLTVNAGPTQTASEGGNVTLAGTAAVSTAGATIASYQWTQIAGPAVTLTNANTANATFTAPAVTSDTVLTFQLTATDSTGASASVAVSVTVYQIEQPLSVNTGSSQTVNERAVVTLTASAADAKPGAAVTSYQWTQIGGPAIVLNVVGTNANFIAPSAAPAPIVDPDQLIRGDFIDPTSPPYTSLYVARQTQLQNWQTSLQAALQSAATPVAGLNAILAAGLNGKQFSDLEALSVQQEAGTDITPQLDILGLTLPAFDYLLQIGTLVQGNQPLLDSEWTNLVSILVQAMKRMVFATWRAQEVAAKLSLSPVYFNAPALLPVLPDTGLNSQGLTIAHGANDPRWTVLSSAGNITPFVTSNAYPIGTAWMVDDANSQWISPQADESTGDNPGLYTYRTTVDLTGYDPASASLQLQVAVDNQLSAVRLNGVGLALTATGFSKFTPLTIDGPFQAGVNTLDLIVFNAGSQPNPSGLRVEFSFTRPPDVVKPTLWRGTSDQRQLWLEEVLGRFSQRDSLRTALQNGVGQTEQLTLAELRDALAAALCFRTIIPSLYSTGVSFARLNQGGGVFIDLQWTITAVNGVAPPNPYAFIPVPANPAWLATGNTSHWIAPSPNEAAGPGDAVGSYTYRTAFDLSLFDPSTVQITMNVAVDNNVTDVKLNGQSLGLIAGSFSGLTALLINSGFVTGINTLDVLVNNAGAAPNPSGLLVEFTSIAPVPVTPDWITQALLIDVRDAGQQKTTRMSQAIVMMQSFFFALRSHQFEQLSPQPGTAVWQLNEPGSLFDQEWDWMGEYSDWQSLMRVFLYPENLLLPSVRLDATAASGEPGMIAEKTAAFDTFVASLDLLQPLTASAALTEANKYLAALNATVSGVPVYPNLPSELNPAPNNLLASYSDATTVDFSALTLASSNALNNYVGPPPNSTKISYLWEAWFFVPIHIALELAKAGLFESALDWFRIVYTYDLPLIAGSDNHRKVFYGLQMESSIFSYSQIPTWMINAANPHLIAVTRAEPYTRFTVLQVVQTLLDFADSQYSTETADSLANARSLYLEATALLEQMEQVLPSDAVAEKNPVLSWMKQQADNRLFCLRSGRNSAGMLLPPLFAFDQVESVQPSSYHYSALMDRAKQLVTVAQQVEGTYLASLAAADNEAYSELKANQDLGTAFATVTLQQLQLQSARDGIVLANDQVAKANDAVSHYDGLIHSDIAQLEQEAYEGYAAAIAGNAIFLNVGGELSSFAEAAQAKASLEEKESDWQFGLSQANSDVAIGLQQVQIATDQQAVASQQLNIANLQVDHAQATVKFLATKFTNADLYRWMSGVLGRVYAYFLQQAASMARLAENQLAFERQQKALSIIRPDYWHPLAGDGGTRAPNNAGLTGAESLLEDITTVDQYAFATNQIKLQITKTISLQQYDPFAFQQFISTGVLRFSTPMTLFDRDFPGQYLRLISQIRVSVVALIPPNMGIYATLSNAGTSRVIVNGDSGYSALVVRRDPQLIALSSPSNPTGLFPMTLSSQSPLLLPFENLGVDTSWELVMPRASNPFDFTTISDVLFTMDYTALDSPVYRQQLVQQLNPSFSADRAYSLRQQFADVWYALNNPGQSPNPMQVQFETLRADFPPNIEEGSLQIAQLLLYFVPSNNGTFSTQPVATLTLAGTDARGNPRTVTGTATAVEGIISTRRGNAASWAPMFGMETDGTWTLDLSNPAVAPLFQNSKVQDMVFVITYNGRLPAWPS